MRSSFNQNKIYIQDCGTFKNINLWDYLNLNKGKESLLTYFLSSLREVAVNIKSVSKFKLSLKLMNHDIIISIPHYKILDPSLFITGLIRSYLNLRLSNILGYLNLKEIKKIMFWNNEIPYQISIADYMRTSVEIKNEDFNLWETVIFLNIVSLFNKVYIANSIMTLSRHITMLKLLNFDHPRITQLHLENTEFTFADLKNNSDSNILLNEHKCNVSSYCLAYFLIQTGLHKSINQIHIKHNDVSFPEDLFRILFKHCAKLNIQLKTRIYSCRLDQSLEVEINNEYLTKMSKFDSTKLESNVNSGIYGTVILIRDS